MWADRGEEVCSFDALLEESQPVTAIARIYTPQGFAVAADGRKLHGITNAIGSDEVQKIFPIKHVSGELIASLAGTGQYSTRHHLVNIGESVTKASRSVSSIPLTHLDYGDALMKALTKMITLLGRPAISGLNEPAKIYLDGYVSGKPVRRTIKLTITDSGIHGEDSADGLVPGHILGTGSQAVSDILFRPL